MPRVNPEDIQLDVRLNFEWKLNEIAEAGFQAVATTLQNVLNDAVAQAKANVEPGHGPGPHPHREGHGYEWEDTGALAEAIHGVMAGEWLGSGKYVGAPEARLVVDPIDVPGRGLVPYGAYLEFGYTPLLM